MSGGGAVDPAADLRRRLGEAAALVAAGGEALERGRVPDLVPLAPTIDALTRDLARLPADESRSLRPALLSFMDEITRLSRRLLAEQTRLGERLRDVGTHRRAGAAYRRTGKP